MTITVDVEITVPAKVRVQIEDGQHEILTVRILREGLVGAVEEQADEAIQDAIAAEIERMESER